VFNEEALYLNGYGCSSILYNTSSENFPGLSFQNWLQMLRFQKMILHMQIMVFGHSFSHKSMRV
jgi:hypothetical protein